MTAPGTVPLNGFRVAQVDDDRWRVSLPHQCDRWEITEDEHGAAVEELEAFIAEAQRALAALRERREVRGDG